MVRKDKLGIEYTLLIGDFNYQVEKKENSRIMHIKVRSREGECTW